MNAARRALRLALGRRLPRTRGTISVAGLEGRVRIRRDRWGIPYVEASTDADAAFATGFCHGQDRAFQLETLLRAGRGTVAELIGADGLPMDRFSRRLGLRRSALAQLDALAPDTREAFEAYARGINAALDLGPRPHELAILRRRPTRWTAADCLCAVKLVALGLATNWDSELGRLRVLELDGPEAVRATDPAYPEWLPVTAPPGSPAGEAIEALAADAAALASVTGGGGSNNWALAASRTATGRPLVANDPHLTPQLPPFWYLIDLRGPDWRAAGASVVGGPGVNIGHNDTIAWGITNGGADVADLFLEEVLDDARSVRGPDGPQECEVFEERIEVRGGEAVVERVLVTPRGPIVTPAVDGDFQPMSMRAVFLDPLPIGPIPGLARARSFEDFRERWRDFPAAPLNLVYADTGGQIAWQFAGQIPRREDGSRGMLPRAGWEESGDGWDGMHDLDELPSCVDPDDGFVATANNKPVADGEGPFLGADWMDGYRIARVAEELASRSDWDVRSAMALQLDRVSVPWREMSEAILATPVDDAHAQRAIELLRTWDGEVAADSVGASVYELFVADLAGRVARARAPRSWEWALGRGAGPLISTTYQGLRWVGHLSALVRSRPDGWLDEGWEAAIEASLAAAVARLEREHGSDRSAWEWGRVRSLTFQHPFGGRPPFDRIFNLGPIPWGGDANTPAQAANSALDPTANPLYLGTLRIAMDVGEWDRSLFSLAGGQSGNPLSPHYDDLFEVWRRGGGVALAWSEDAVAAAARDELRLEPAL
jgi:penicillin amidase